jgi:hypothetical protein
MNNGDVETTLILFSFASRILLRACLSAPVRRNGEAFSLVEIRLPIYGAKMPYVGSFRTQHEDDYIAYAQNQTLHNLSPFHVVSAIAFSKASTMGSYNFSGGSGGVSMSKPFL